MKDPILLLGLYQLRTPEFSKLPNGSTSQMVRVPVLVPKAIQGVVFGTSLKRSLFYLYKGPESSPGLQDPSKGVCSTYMKGQKPKNVGHLNPLELHLRYVTLPVGKQYRARILG